MIQTTLVLIKPDGVKRGLIGEILKRFEQRGLKIVGMKLVHITKDSAAKHYKEDIAARYGEKARQKLLRYLCSGPVVALAIQGVSAISIVRKIIGSTYPEEAQLGTIRGDFAHISKAYVNYYDTQTDIEKNVYNLVHASGNEKEASEELSLWFSKEELFNYETVHDSHVI